VGSQVRVLLGSPSFSTSYGWRLRQPFFVCGKFVAISTIACQLGYAAHLPSSVACIASLFGSIDGPSLSNFDYVDTGIGNTRPESVTQITSGESRVDIFLSLFERARNSDYRYSVLGGKNVFVKHRSSLIRLEDFFYEEPPVFWFVDGSSLDGNTFTPLKTKYAPYDRDKIAVWKGEGVDLRKESQGVAKAKDTVDLLGLLVWRQSH
jgi:hypothetical protein